MQQRIKEAYATGKTVRNKEANNNNAHTHKNNDHTKNRDTST